MSEHQVKKKREDRRQTAPDTGIARFQSGHLIREETRDVLAAQDWSKPRNLAVIATSQELKYRGWSGIRHNTFTNDIEIWLLGRIAARENYNRILTNPELVATLHEKAFSTVGSILVIDDPKAKEES